MMNDTEQLMAEINLDLDVLVTLTDRRWTPKTRGIMAAAKIDRTVREWFGVRSVL